MCPLRFILVFFSALLAGFLAWRSLRSSSEIDFVAIDNNDDFSEEKTPKSPLKDDDEYKQERTLRKTVEDGFWVFVDMATGKYLWKNFKEMNKDAKVKSS